MALHYDCRHCGTRIGSIEHPADSRLLGLSFLSDEERKDMVVYEPSGDVRVASICEDCYEAFERNPELHQNNYIIQ